MLDIVTELVCVGILLEPQLGVRRNEAVWLCLARELYIIVLNRYDLAGISEVFLLLKVTSNYWACWKRVCHLLGSLFADEGTFAVLADIQHLDLTL